MAVLKRSLPPSTSLEIREQTLRAALTRRDGTPPTLSSKNSFFAAPRREESGQMAAPFGPFDFVKYRM
jgi:hypothetical protein